LDSFLQRSSPQIRCPGYRVRLPGLGDATVRALLRRNELNTSAQVADIYRALDELGLTPGQLLYPPAPVEPDDTSDDDVSTLAGLLMTERVMHLPDRLALALGWTLDRLIATVHVLDARLRPAGLRVHRNTMGITLRPATDHADEAKQRLADLRDDEDGIHQGTARVLDAVYTGDISTRETRNDHQVQLGALKNRGAITFGHGDGNRYTVADDVAFALRVGEISARGTTQ
jgi:hypothetical protein